MTATRTFATLEVPKPFYDLVAEKLRAAGYDQAFVDDAIDMHGLALVVSEETLPPPAATKPIYGACEDCGQHVLISEAPVSAIERNALARSPR